MSDIGFPRYGNPCHRSLKHGSHRFWACQPICSRATPVIIPISPHVSPPPLVNPLVNSSFVLAQTGKLSALGSSSIRKRKRCTARLVWMVLSFKQKFSLKVFHFRPHYNMTLTIRAPPKRPPPPFMKPFRIWVGCRGPRYVSIHPKPFLQHAQT